MEEALMWLCLFGFLAGLTDSIVGGGGLVQVPAFFVLYPHLPVPYVIGTNRLASAAGTSVAAWNYSRQVPIPWKSVFLAGVVTAVFAYIGATLQSAIPSSVLKPFMLLIMIAIGIFTYTKKDFGHKDEMLVAPRHIPLYAAAIGAVMGMYNGLIGPGTGSLLIFALIRVIGYSFIPASGIAKVINVIADIGSLIFLLLNQYVLFHIALPLLVCNVLGSYLGSRLAILKGNAFVRRFFLVVVAAIILRFSWDVVQGFR